MVKTWLSKIDIALLISILGLLVISLIALYSSSLPAIKTGSGTNYFFYQSVWISLGILIMVFISIVPNKWISNSAYYLFGLSIIFLILVVFFGSSGSGATRWIRLGFIRFQPSEFAKIGTLLAVARFLSDKNVNINRVPDFITASLIVFIPFILVVRQPDLGTALVFLSLILPLYYWAGLKPGNLFLIVAPGLVLICSFEFYTFLIVMIIIVGYLFMSRRGLKIGSLVFILNITVGLITPYIWNHLKPYQQQRIKVFWNPEADPLGSGYQIIQSKVAIGSGGFFGKGFLQGSQTQLRFLPEQHTDFIIGVIGEEFGFFGVFAALILFSVLFYRGIKLASIVRNPFNSIVTIGIITIIGFQMMVNIGMTIGFLPVTGIPLPFISYGGSAMLANLIMMGILLNFFRNKFEY